MIDIDHFKKVNDRYGHLTGDLILKGVASVLRRKVRGCDVSYRYGGEEMAVILPGANLAAALATAERVREAVQSTTFLGAKGKAVPITLSIGAAQRDPGTQSPHDLIERADKALYHSKKAGRNRTSKWPLPRRRAAGKKKTLLSERKAPKRPRRVTRATRKTPKKTGSGNQSMAG